uniref:Dolichyl-diphosphooligosaccharide--protein glycosyltransferase subunit 1 n=1 Tax=Panagrolaimus sp. PS1159 TaxID=55785 RepID=A0AC35GSP5_9BILA
MRSGICLIALISAVIIATSAKPPPSDLLLTVSRNIDISTQLSKYVLNINAKNKGNDVTYFIHPISKEQNLHLSYITANEGKGKKLHVSKVEDSFGNSDYIYYKIEFLSTLKKDSSLDFQVEYVLSEYLKIYPTEIAQSESQFTLWEGSSNYVSVYPIESDKSTVKIGHGKALSHTGTKSGDKIQYGPTKNVAPFTSTKVSIHYENNAPFIVVTNLERIIEVSHWGNIAIEDQVEIVHKGAKLKGSFSRLDFQVDRRTNSPIVKSFKATLPAQARDIYYRDQIGNISTSMVRGYDNRVEVDMRPRFPLLGGWRTNYIFGYNVPSSEFLYSSGSSFALKIPLIHPLYDNMLIEKAQIKIILPETSHNIKIVKPYSVSQLPDSLHFTYLDIVGRPVITLEKNNLVEYHSQPFTIYYEFTSMSMFREPILVIGALMLIYCIFIVFNRLDFSIVPKDGNIVAHSKTD